MKTVQGDLLDVKKGFIIQQCNCNTVKSHGLSLAIERRFPYCDVYKGRKAIGTRNCAATPSVPGTYEVFTHPNEDDHPVIVCLMAQWAPGKPGAYERVYPAVSTGERDTYENRLAWFREAMTDFVRHCVDTKVDFSAEPLCIPYQIGCGLAGGNWDEYQKVLQKIEDTFNIEFIVYKLD